MTIARNTDRRVAVQNGTFSSVAEDTKAYPSAFIKAYRKHLAQAKWGRRITGTEVMNDKMTYSILGNE